jgi:hypothetical protein
MLHDFGGGGGEGDLGSILGWLHTSRYVYNHLVYRENLDFVYKARILGIGWVWV